jgi:hypothetical protein
LQSTLPQSSIHVKIEADRIDITVEIIGYIGRAVSAQDIWALGPYIVQSLLLLLAPALFAATIYMTLGRIIHRLNAGRYSMIPLRWLTKIFVIGDVISFLTQMGGKLYRLSRRTTVAEC